MASFCQIKMAGVFDSRHARAHAICAIDVFIAFVVAMNQYNKFREQFFPHLHRKPAHSSYLESGDEDNRSSFMRGIFSDGVDRLGRQRHRRRDRIRAQGSGRPPIVRHHGTRQTQVAYAKVALNIVNIQTSEVVFSSQEDRMMVQFQEEKKLFPESVVYMDFLMAKIQKSEQ